MIEDQLELIATASKFKILFAAEAGSRAWGFASKDSDFDVRFIYVRPLADYLRLDPLSESYNTALDNLDFAGWDLRKALNLARRSNPSLIEWLQSPVVYADRNGFRDRLRDLVKQTFNPRNLGVHYYHFMKNVRGAEYGQWKGETTLKRYLYALRPIFTVLWMREHDFVLPPCEFAEVAKLCPSDLKGHVAQLLYEKARGVEATTASLPALDKYIQTWFALGLTKIDELPFREFRDAQPFNSFFLNELKGTT